MVTNDLDVMAVFEISKELQNEYRNCDNGWEGSPFAWIKTKPSRQIGAIGEKLVDKWLTDNGLRVTRPHNSDSDRMIENVSVEIKFSTLWANGRYKFQQLRDQRYELCICFGVSPFNAHCWVIPKGDIVRLWKVDRKILSQHGGKNGTDTAWIDVVVDRPPSWITPYGGSLSEAMVVLSNFLHPVV